MAIITAAIIAAGGAAIGGGISAYGSSQAAKSAQKNQQGAFNDAQGYLDALAGGGNLEEIFGSKLDPEAFLYHPVDITQSQLDTISGNLRAFPSALNLTNKVNPEIWKNDLSRIRTMMPGFDQARDSYIGATQRLLQGRLPFQDVEDIVSNRSSVSGMLGTPGGSRAATMRDLGQSRLGAIQSGGSMFQQFIQMAEAISPVSSQMRPQQMFFTPQERLQADILQRSLEQQGMASAAMAEAMPDPAQNALANANIGLNMARLGSSYQPTSGMGMQALGQGISSAAGIFGSIYGMQGQNKSTPSFNNPYTLNGSGMSIGASPFTSSVSPSYGSNYMGGGGGMVPLASNPTNMISNPMWSYTSGALVPPLPNTAPYYNSLSVPSAQASGYQPQQPYVATSGWVQSALNNYGSGWYKP